MLEREHVLYLDSFVASILLAFHTPFISLFAIDLGASPFDIGLITGVAPFFYAMMASVSGFIIGKTGEVKIIWFSFIGLTLSYFWISRIDSCLSLLFLNIFSTLSYSFFWPAVESLISKKSVSAKWFTTSWSIGTLIGSIFIGLLLEYSKRYVFIIMSFISLFAFLTSIFIKHKENSLEPLKIKEILYALRSKPFAWIQAYTYSFIQGSIFSFYPVIVMNKQFPELYIALVISTITLSRTFLFYIHDMIEKIIENNYIGGILILVVGGLSFIKNIFILFIASSMLGLGLGILYIRAIKKSFSSPDSKRSIYTGLFESFIGLGYSIGPLITGFTSSISIDYMLVPIAVLGVLFLFSFPYYSMIKES